MWCQVSEQALALRRTHRSYRQVLRPRRLKYSGVERDAILDRQVAASNPRMRNGFGNREDGLDVARMQQGGLDRIAVLPDPQPRANRIPGLSSRDDILKGVSISMASSSEKDTLDRERQNTEVARRC